MTMANIPIEVLIKVISTLRSNGQETLAAELEQYLNP